MKTLHLFDFDETLSKIDSAKFFYKKIAKPFLYAFCYYMIPFNSIVRYFIFQGSSFNIKKRRLSAFLKYSSSKKVKNFIDNSDEFVNLIIRKDAKKKLNKLKENNENEIYIVSASFSFLLEKWVAKENFKLITNNVNIDLISKNVIFLNQFDCDGFGKLLLIKEQICLNNYKRIIAYGDTPNDFPMFSIAHEFYYRPFKK